MRVAETLPRDTIHPYIAFRSSCICALQNGIRHIATPMFCTGTGGVSAETAAYQMKEALLSIQNRIFYKGDWKTFHEHHRKLRNQM